MVKFTFARLTHSFEHVVSGGIATEHPNNKLTINAIEGASLEDFSIEVR